MKYIKLNKFDKEGDLIWNHLDGTATSEHSGKPLFRAVFSMTRTEKAEFVELERTIKDTEFRKSSQNVSNIYIIERD